MLESDDTTDNNSTTDTAGDSPAESQADSQSPAAPRKRAPRKTTKKAAASATEPAADDAPQAATVAEPAAKAVKATKRTRKSAKTTPPADSGGSTDVATDATDAPGAPGEAETAAGGSGANAANAAKSTRAPRKRAAKSAAPADVAQPPADTESAAAAPAMAAPAVLFVAPDPALAKPARKRPAKAARAASSSDEPAPASADVSVAEAAEDATAEPEDVREAAADEATGARRRRRRGRRGRGGRGNDDVDGADTAGDDQATGRRNADADADASTEPDTTSDDTTSKPAKGGRPAKGSRPAKAAKGGGGGDADADQDSDSDEASAATKRRRRRRRSGGSDGDATEDDPPNTVVHVRTPREEGDGVKGVKGSTRLEAKRQRRRDGRESGRRRPPILTEAEFLARREAVNRVMAVRQNGDRTQIAVLEDDLLVEHYVTRASATSYVGNVYLGRVQNVLPSMEAAFVDIGKGRNGVLYAGEVNWDAAGLEGKSRAIENALNGGDTVLVQVTKDPIGHKGARLTSQVSLPGRFLVYVPGGGMTGISRKLPDTERHRLKAILKKIVPEDAGVIVRTAAEGASEEDLTHDVERLKAQWETMSKKAAKTSSAPTLVHGEPDLAIRVVRDVFNEDFNKLVVQGEDAWTTVSEYVTGVAPELRERVSRHTGDTDLFHELRVDEQLMKALDRKVWLPSGGSLVIDRTEAMTVIDVNTGKFVGAGGNLEQTVTRNNLEAAEEIVRQLRLRDVGGIVVIDFIDMVLESNRELVLRRLTECLGRDRTKHQVAEVTSLGLVQMTRKRVGEGLLEAFSEICTVCNGRGVIVHSEPVDKRAGAESGDEDRSKSRRRRGGRKNADADTDVETDIEVEAMNPEQRRAALAAMAAVHRAAHGDDGEPMVIHSDFAEAAAELEMEAVAVVLDAQPIDPEPADADAVVYNGSHQALGEANSPAELPLPLDDSDASASSGGHRAHESVTAETGADNGAQPETHEPETHEPEPHEPAAHEHGAHEAEAQAAEAQEAEAHEAEAPPTRRRRRGASRPAGPPVTVDADTGS